MVFSDITVLKQTHKAIFSVSKTKYIEFETLNTSLLLDYLVLLVSSSVPRLQKRVGLGAARGLHSNLTCPPRAAGTSLRTGFNLKSGAWTEIG